MKFPVVRHVLRLVLFFPAVSMGLLTMAEADDRSLTLNDSPVTATVAEPVGRKRARLLYQETATSRLMTTDLYLDATNQPILKTPTVVPGFPNLDPQRQKLVQQDTIGSRLLVGVRDDDRGQYGSGWVMVDSGVTEEPHGDHSHWEYRPAPAVCASRIDTSQGNPAHLYRYEDRFYLANDQKNGYSMIDPTPAPGTSWPTGLREPVRFYGGGGRHITLAAVGHQVGYATWIDAGGPEKGRIDITPLSPLGSERPVGSFLAGSGNLHGATACAGKVFFAPAEGIDWIEADLSAKNTSPQVHHLSLGEQEGRPRRTGAFTTSEGHVLCATGRGEGSSLVLIDARSMPMVTELKLLASDSHKAVTPTVIKDPKGRHLAWLFLDHDAESSAEDKLCIIDLDPNRDGSFADAALLASMPVGSSAVEGHTGHHDIAFDAGRRYAFWTNPGAKSLTLCRTSDFSVITSFPLPEQPGAVAAFGGLETHD